MADRDSFRSWSNTLVSAGLASDPDLAAQVRNVVAQLVAYIVNLLVDRRSSPGDDLLSALVDVRDGSDRLSEDELLSMVFLMLIAGHETTVN